MHAPCPQLLAPLGAAREVLCVVRAWTTASERMQRLPRSRDGAQRQQPMLESACCAALRRAGGTMTAVMSAANEKAVEVFLREEIEYLDIVPLVAACCEAHKADLTARPSIDDIVAFDQWARDWTHEHAKTFKRSMATA